jgi:hypothetical protein
MLPQNQQIMLDIDYASITKKHESPTGSVHPDLMDWENWAEASGKNHYSTGARHVTGVQTFTHETRRDMGINTVYSGGALRKIKKEYSIPSIDIVKHHSDAGHNFTRLDLCIDFIDTGVKVDEFRQAFLNGECFTALKEGQIFKSDTGPGETYYIGSLKARKKLVRIYDKGAERNMDADVDWIRVEYEIHQAPAVAAAAKLSASHDLRSTILSICAGIADFPTITIFKDLMEGIVPVKIGSISSEKGKTREWLLDPVVKSLGREIIKEPVFLNEFFEELHRYVDFVLEKQEKYLALQVLIGANSNTPPRIGFFDDTHGVNRESHPNDTVDDNEQYDFPATPPNYIDSTVEKATKIINEQFEIIQNIMRVQKE